VHKVQVKIMITMWV